VGGFTLASSTSVITSRLPNAEADAVQQYAAKTGKCLSHAARDLLNLGLAAARGESAA